MVNNLVCHLAFLEANVLIMYDTHFKYFSSTSLSILTLKINSLHSDRKIEAQLTQIDDFS